MKRREFITLLGSVAAGWPLVAYAQQPKRRVAVLMSGAAADREIQAHLAAFLDGLQRLGWTDGLNVQIDTRWASGFSSFDYSLSGKWLELLKQIAPNLTRVAVLRDPALAAGIGQFAVIQAMAPPSFGVELTPIDVRDPSEIKRSITAFARERNGGMIVTASPPSATHRDLIISLASQYHLPNVYPYRYYPASGGLASYGPDQYDVHRRAAGYVNRVLKGEKPADLPVQTPTKYDLVINLKTAKAFGLTVPSSLLATADEVIE
jgi:putative tryptophan/tyrosine transport system substrate-binding protein